jgi:hypothetical protein
MGTKMRTMIFQKYSGKEQPWLVGDGQVNQFEVNKDEARDFARQWWESNFQFTPPNAGSAEKTMEAAEYEEWKEYAIMKAGEEQLRKMG